MAFVISQNDWIVEKPIILEDYEMKRHYIDEKTGISYTLQGDYYLPDLILPAKEVKRIGMWGQWHKRYLKEHGRVIYTNLLASGKLNAYLADIGEQAEERGKLSPFSLF